MNAIGIIFANLHEKNIPELTGHRTIGSVPFGCRYRLIDFALSNMVNSGITDVRIATQSNYGSLMDHIGSGKDWDLARRSGGIKILAPSIQGNQSNYSGLGFSSRLEALKAISSNLMHIKEEYIIMADCDGICNIDLNGLLQDHIEHGADITMMVKPMKFDGAIKDRVILLDADENNNITDIAVRPAYAEGVKNAALNISVISKNYLHTVLQEANAHGYSSLTLDIMMKNIGKRNYRVYPYDGAFEIINSTAEYFSTSMALLSDYELRKALFGIDERPIFTKIRNSAPTRHIEGSHVKNSMIADGCTIEGTVENCILFRGVKIGRGAVVKNCILFQDTVVGENVQMNCVISDKNAVIRDGSLLAGHAKKPYYIEKNQML